MPIQIACSAMSTVLRPMATASATLPMSSGSTTMSAASLAAVAPRAPMAIPMSAAASTGASLTPSPTIAMGRCGECETNSTLSTGRQFACTSSMPSAAAMCSAVARSSPVSMVTARTPCARSAAMVADAFGRTSSRNTSAPAKAPSIGDVDRHLSTGQWCPSDLPARLLRDVVALADGNGASRHVARSRRCPSLLPHRRIRRERPRGRSHHAGSPSPRYGSSSLRRMRQAGAACPAACPPRPDGDESGLAPRERSGLVECEGAYPMQLLERRAAADDDAVAGGAAHPGHERHRCGDDQRTRRGDDQHFGETGRVCRRATRPDRRWRTR